MYTLKTISCIAMSLKRQQPSSLILFISRRHRGYHPYGTKPPANKQSCLHENTIIADDSERESHAIAADKPYNGIIPTASPRTMPRCKGSIFRRCCVPHHSSERLVRQSSDFSNRDCRGSRISARSNAKRMKSTKAHPSCHSRALQSRKRVCWCATIFRTDWFTLPD